MKRNYLQMRLFFFSLMMMSAYYSQAQVVTACNDPEGGIQIWFDYNQHCPNSPGSLAGMQQIGFHSGANGWASVVEWDKAGATTGMNTGNDVFVVDLPDPDAYYGVPVTAINFVFNQGPVNPADPWGAEGKEDNGTGGCNDFYIPLADITQTCQSTSAVHDLILHQHMTIAPNPFTDFAVVRFENSSRQEFEVMVRNSVGQLVNEVHHFSGDEFVFSKDNHPAGFYFVTVTNAKGKFFSGQMVIQ
ncbi:MAG: T9SS type A sorting domain-containing protein [Saprospiraceae bacterium]